MELTEYIARRSRETRLYALLIALSSVTFSIFHFAGIPFQIQEPIGAVALVVWFAGVYSERVAAKHEKEML
jgi:hypothetical protein